MGVKPHQFEPHFASINHLVAFLWVYDLLADILRSALAYFNMLIASLRIPRIFQEVRTVYPDRQYFNVHIAHLSWTVPTLSINVLESRLTLRICINVNATHTSHSGSPLTSRFEEPDDDSSSGSSNCFGRGRSKLHSSYMDILYYY